MLTFNREALSLIKKRGYAKFDFDIDQYMNFMTILRYANEMQACPMTSWKLILPKLHDIDQFGVVSLSMQEKFQYDLNSLINQYM